MANSPHIDSIEIIFEEELTLSDGNSKPYSILLQLTNESIVIRSETRNVLIKRDPNTHSFGFSIKGGIDTGFPIVISRVMNINSHLLRIGDAILSINNEDITNLTHDQVINKLHDLSNDEISLTIKYMYDIAKYLHLTSPNSRMSVPLFKSHTKFNEISLQQNRNRFSVDNYDNVKSQVKYQQINSYFKMKEYSLLFAFVSQYINGTDKLRLNSFEIYTHDDCQTGLFITNTSIQKDIWIKKLNTVIRNLTRSLLDEFNQKLLSNEQIFYANWIHERILNLNQMDLPKWTSVFIVFKGIDLYMFDDKNSLPLSISDFISCKRIYSIVEVFLEIISSKYSISKRPYCFTLTLPNDSVNQYRYLNFETKYEYDDFVANYRRALYVSVYTIQNRTFGCLYQGKICRFVVDINKGFQMYNNETNVLLWRFKFDQLHSSTDNGRSTIYLTFKNYFSVNDYYEPNIHIEIQCQHLRVLVHVINAFLTVKLISQHDDIFD